MKVTKAETIMSGMLAEMNIPISAFSCAMEVMFPDSEIAQKFQCGRSKATALVKELSQATRQDLLTNMRMMPFTVSTDGSNGVDSGNKQFHSLYLQMEATVLTVATNSSLHCIYRWKQRC